ncbi:MAG: Gfo/Idh/MocA family oxidoreductase [Methyloprofundus sp.]|nr:Gfo/Idh/MocA family oxidoreductase [Methyloprofundus sp.]MDT8425209.1 Gfo/Idh/MocA family oxidoreductase [Methyloprofundus sp.]
MLHVLIVGCGNIAGGFDATRPAFQLPYTHAGAFSRDTRFELVACVEPDQDKRNEFMRFWNIGSGWADISQIPKAFQVDVISICSPTKYHVQHLRAAIAFQPKLIFCEKPLATSTAQAEQLVSQCQQLGILLAVNYTRAWDPAIVDLKWVIDKGTRGALRSVVGFYNKGILNNGSHLLDLLVFLIGKLQIISVGQPVFDFFEDDPSVSVLLQSIAGVNVHLVPGNAQDFAFFEIHFVFSQGVLVMEESGLSWRDRCLVESESFKGYQYLNAGEFKKGTYANSMLNALDNIFHAVQHDQPLNRNGNMALEVQRLCEQIRKLALKQ